MKFYSLKLKMNLLNYNLKEENFGEILLFLLVCCQTTFSSRLN